MTSYLGGGKSFRPHKNNSHNNSGQPREYHQDMGQVNSHSGHTGTPYTSDYLVVSHPRLPLLFPRPFSECD